MGGFKQANKKQSRRKNDDGVEPNMVSPFSILSGIDWNHSSSKVVPHFYTPGYILCKLLFNITL